MPKKITLHDCGQEMEIRGMTRAQARAYMARERELRAALPALDPKAEGAARAAQAETLGQAVTDMAEQLQDLVFSTCYLTLAVDTLTVHDLNQLYGATMRWNFGPVAEDEAKNS
jgi:hypothetical protein